MATVKLEFELDSEVYPELHAALSGLRSTRSRAERMRQLAAAGLVWEKVRLHGAAAVQLVEPSPSPSGLVTRPDVRPALPPEPAEPLPQVERRASSRRSRATAADRRPPGDFVDLAINAEPVPVPPSRKDLEQVMRELPVLVDVVEDVEPLPEHHDEVEEVADSAGWASLNAYPDDVPPPSIDMPADIPAADHHDDDEEGSDLPDATLHVTALSHKPATRNRLMKMKERGLFKNG